MHQFLHFEPQVFENARVLGHQIQLSVVRKLLLVVELVLAVLILVQLVHPVLPPQYVVLLFKHLNLVLALAVLSYFLVHLSPYYFCVLEQMCQLRMHFDALDLPLCLLAHKFSVVC